MQDVYEPIDPMTLSEEEEEEEGGDPEDYVDVVPPPNDQEEYVDVPPSTAVSLSLSLTASANMFIPLWLKFQTFYI